MKFTPLPLEGAYLIEEEPKWDERGSFSRQFCATAFASQGLVSHFVQMNHSFSHAEGTLRGLHYQLPPKSEVKLVQCIRGKIYDVMVDLRPSSKSFRRVFALELKERDFFRLYIPAGCAHGFLTLAPESEVSYLVSEEYSPSLERGVRWDDPLFAIEWPFIPTLISARDQAHPLFREEPS